MSIKIKQRDNTDCGAACLASVGEYYKLKMPISQIRQLAGTDKMGTSVFGIIKAAELMGFTAKGVKSNADALFAIPLPAIVHIELPFNGMKYGHYVVLYKTKGKKLFYMDPSDGKMHTEYVDNFSKTFTGIIILISPNDSFQKHNYKISNFSRFVFLAKPHRMVLIQCLIGSILYTILGLSTSIYIGKITDYVLIGGNLNLLNVMSIGMILIMLFRAILDIAQSKLMLNTGQQIDVRLILGYYKHLLTLPQTFFDTMRVGEIISRISDAAKIRTFVNDTIIALIVNSFIVIFSLILMFVYNSKLALIMLLCIPFYITLSVVVNFVNKKQERKVMERTASLEGQFVESINSIRTIKQFGIENYENEKTEKKFIRLIDTIYHSGINAIFTRVSTSFFNNILVIVILWIGAILVVNSEITAGVFFSFYAVIGYFISPIEYLINSNKIFQNAVIAADRLFEIMDLEREKGKETETLEFTPKMNGDIVFDKVSFSYGTRRAVFTDFSLTIEKSKITAIVGASGSGKTTLSLLLQRLYPLNSGKILIGDNNLNYFSHDSIRRYISSVPQQLDLFSGNIIENIALGDYNPDMEKICSICKELGIYSFIDNLPDGFNSKIGEHGIGLSGGEKQRIAIARALYSNPEILILDESTSSLDIDSESKVQDTLINFNKKGKTVIIIAHRLSTIKLADRINIIENGKLVESGNHDTLLKKGTRYYEMWEKYNINNQ